MKTFAEIKEILKQRELGLVTDAECLLACQLHPYQVDALLAMQKLPLKAFQKLDIADMEPDWDRLASTELPRFAQEDKPSNPEPKFKFLLEPEGYYRSRLGKLFHVKKLRDGTALPSYPDHYWYDEGSGTWNIRWNEVGRFLPGKSEFPSFDFMIFDLVAAVTKEEFEAQTGGAQGFVVYFRLALDRYYGLANGDMVHVTYMENGKFAAKTRHISVITRWSEDGSHESDPDYKILCEVNRSEYELWASQSPNAYVEESSAPKVFKLSGRGYYRSRLGRVFHVKPIMGMKDTFVDAAEDNNALVWNDDGNYQGENFNVDKWDNLSWSDLVAVATKHEFTSQGNVTRFQIAVGRYYATRDGNMLQIVIHENDYLLAKKSKVVSPLERWNLFGVHDHTSYRNIACEVRESEFLSWEKYGELK